MKTTVEIPDRLYPQAKAQAIAEGMTLGSLLVRSLERALPTVPEKDDPPLIWPDRKLSPDFRKLWKRGGFSGGTDSTQIISEERDAR